MRLPAFEYAAPTSLSEASALLTKNNGQALLMAGGTDVLVSLKHRLHSPALLVSLNAVPGLDYITSADGVIRIGALTPLRTVRRSALLAESVPALVQAAVAVGADKHQNRGTLGGNICLDTRCYYFNQSDFWRTGRTPCHKLGGDLCYVVRTSKTCYATYSGDTAPALLAMGATVTVVDGQGSQTMPLSQLYSGDGHHPLTLKPGQLVSEIQIPVPAARSASTYLKLRARQSIDFPMVGVAAAVTLDEKGICQKAGIALTAVAQQPVAATEAAAALIGQPLTDEAIAKAAQAAMSVAHPVANMAQGSPSYRRRMVEVLTDRALRGC